jgi:hypothetical protein
MHKQDHCPVHLCLSAATRHPDTCIMYTFRFRPDPEFYMHHACIALDRLCRHFIACVLLQQFSLG